MGFCFGRWWFRFGDVAGWSSRWLLQRWLGLMAPELTMGGAAASDWALSAGQGREDQRLGLLRQVRRRSRRPWTGQRADSSGLRVVRVA
ncbi:hypothetical protein M0R45_006559 [Rubus argutus]|uniref:Secreted protein n=1 Tax=Rubus argutus TaxID=59490 RepID=A0AAW1YR44_RUBAR